MLCIKKVHNCFTFMSSDFCSPQTQSCFPANTFSFKYTFFRRKHCCTNPKKMLQSHRMRIISGRTAARKAILLFYPLFLPQKNFFGGFFHENLAEGFGMQPFPHA